jgi:hypothetical protein
MPRPAAATAPARHPRTAPARRAPKKRAPARRSSGPATGRAAAATRTAPRPARPAPLVRRVAAGPIGHALDWILRGRACVVLFGALLVGVVFFNVSLLEKNEGIAHMNQQSATVAMQNQKLRAELAVYSSEWVQTEAEKRGYYLPAAGDQRFIKRGDVDTNARKAARRIVAPGQGTGTASKPGQNSTAVQPGEGTLPGGGAPSAQTQAQQAQAQTQATAPAPTTTGP